MKMVLRVVIAVLFASIAGAIWLSVSFEIINSTVIFHRAFSLAAVASGIVFFAAIVCGVIAVLGVPAYFLARHFGLNELVWGAIYGFILAMFGGFGFAAPWSDLSGVAVFGCAGIVAAIVFLYAMRVSARFIEQAAEKLSVVIPDAANGSARSAAR